MRMFDIIAKKRDGKVLSNEEIEFFVNGYVKGEIPDYQISALLMAVYFNGMNDDETTALTMLMAKSGEMIDLSSIPGVKVDKHSTGGVGDKTTFIISPIVASCCVPVAKMSGRGLGHTGGTIDKMESIPGMRTNIEREKFFEIVRNVGACVIGQSGNIVPADKKFYALRDVTATINSIPLIASSIMSKKIAAGSDAILLDVKAGSGAFMKTTDDAIKLAQAMVAIGEKAGRRTIALITDMDRPLGRSIGNALEMKEVCDTLNGKGPDDLTELCLDLCANMLYLADKGNLEECYNMAKTTLESGKGFEKLKEMVKAQGGDVSVIEDNSKFEKAKVVKDFVASKDGYIFSMDTEKCGIASMILGAGREKKEDNIDYSAGIILHKKIGDSVKRGDVVASLYSSTEQKCENSCHLLSEAINISEIKPKINPIILARVTKDKVEKY